MFKEIQLKSCAAAIASSTFLAFGLYHVHSLSGITEGGLLGLNLLLEYWFDISPAVTNFTVSLICYLTGWKLLGRKFIIYSAIASSSFSLAYKVFEQFDPLWPQLYNMPLLAAVIGALFVGIGTGICVRIGGAVCGDDALAMCISHKAHINVEWAYLISDLTVLGLSLTYIPLNRIAYSLLTVVISGQVIGWIQRVEFQMPKLSMTTFFGYQGNKRGRFS
ncbi:MAG: YitT family protein [Ruminococcus sp.]|nr:YitT family protein [Ruminococcus sp.]